MSKCTQRLSERYWPKARRYAAHLARRLCVPISEAIGEAGVAITVCEQRWRPDRGTQFTTLLYLAIWRRLIDWKRRNARHEENRVDLPRCLTEATEDDCPLTELVTEADYLEAERLLRGETLYNDCTTEHVSIRLTITRGD